MAKIEIDSEVLRGSGPCSAISFDSLRCDLRHAHEGNHQTHRGACIRWPDSERNVEKSQKHEDQIWARLLKGEGHWQPYREPAWDDD